MNSNDYFEGFAPETAPASASSVLALCEEPQARIEQYGPAGLSDVELLALILQGSGFSPSKAMATARAIIIEAGSLLRLLSWHPEQFKAIPGLGDAKTAQVLAALELSRRLRLSDSSEAPKLDRASEIAAHMQPQVAGLEIEKFWVLCLNRKNRLLKSVLITTGTATAALAHPREVFRAAIRESAAAIVCVHNHPSGDPAPSAPDLQVTRLLREAAKAVDIELLDHVICGWAGADPLARGYFSFREAGLL